jgi:hypothetical protein
VSSDRPTSEQLLKLAKSEPEKIADLVLLLWDQVMELSPDFSSAELRTVWILV